MFGAIVILTLTILRVVLPVALVLIAGALVYRHQRAH